MEEYPNIFNIAMDKYSSIAQKMTNNTWDVHFRRLQSWKLGSLMEMLAKVEAHSIDENELDRLSWASKCIITVKVP